jgi:hypothetical protein
MQFFFELLMAQKTPFMRLNVVKQKLVGVRDFLIAESSSQISQQTPLKAFYLRSAGRSLIIDIMCGARQLLSLQEKRSC